MHPCPFCHAPLPQNAPFCPTCGQQIEWVLPPQPPPVETQAAVEPPRGSSLAPPSILSRELSMQHEAPGSVLARSSESGSSFRVARPLPPEDSSPPSQSVRGVLDAARATPPPRVAKVAPLWRRSCAWLVDAAVLLVILWGFLWIAAGLVQRGSPSRQTGLDWLAATLLAYGKIWVPSLALFSLITVGYLALFTALGGQTPGKRLLGLQVVDANGDEPGILRSAMRALLALGSGLLVLMGFLLVVFDRRRQALHDKLAHTYVICQG